MYDVCFDLYSLGLVPEACLKAEKSVRQSLNGLWEVARKLDEELSSFTEYGHRAEGRIGAHISEIRALIRTVDERISGAQGKKQTELPPPSEPSIPSNATPTQKKEIEAAYREQVHATEERNARIRQENQRIDEYCARCNGVKQELEELIAALSRLEESMRKKVSSAISTASGLLEKARGDLNASGTVNGAVSEFRNVFVHVLEDAQELCWVKASSVRGYSYVDRLFVIRNRHTHYAVATGNIFGSLSEGDAAPGAPDAIPPDADEELLIRTKDRTAFLAAAQNAKRVRMPSANLHKLGGKAFLADMSALGFHTVTQADGSIMDTDGMIHWEK